MFWRKRGGKDNKSQFACLSMHFTEAYRYRYQKIKCLSNRDPSLPPTFSGSSFPFTHTHTHTHAEKNPQVANSPQSVQSGEGIVHRAWIVVACLVHGLLAACCDCRSKKRPTTHNTKTGHSTAGISSTYSTLISLICILQHFSRGKKRISIGYLQHFEYVRSSLHPALATGRAFFFPPHQPAKGTPYRTVPTLPTPSPSSPKLGSRPRDYRFEFEFD